MKNSKFRRCRRKQTSTVLKTCRVSSLTMILWIQFIQKHAHLSLLSTASSTTLSFFYIPVFSSPSSSSSSDLDDPLITVHQSVGEAKEQFYFERTVFLRCVANSNPPVHYTWRRGREALTQGSDSGVEIYEPFFTQVKTHTLYSY